MRLWVTSLAAVASLTLAAPGAGAAPPTPPARIAVAPDAALAARVDKVIDSAIADHRLVGTVVLVARDGKLVYHRAAGLADREAGRPMGEDAVFRFSSVTKPFVTAAAMRLVEEGKLHLDDPVTKWLPDFQPRLADGTQPVITVRQLLNHTSGLTYGLAEPPSHPYHALGVSDGIDLSGITLDENLRRLGKAPLSFPPGSAWRYSLAIDVLGGVMEKATGQTLPQVLAQAVTTPLGLADTGFVARDPARLTAAYVNAQPAPTRMTDNLDVSLGATAVRFAPSRATDPTAFPSGGAGMVGTAGDVLAFLEALRQGGAPILKPATVAQMMQDQVGVQAATQGPGWGFGYGWAVLDDPAVAKTPQAAGTIAWGGVYGHNWFVDPKSGLTVVLMTNTAFEGMNGAFTVQLRDAVYGR
ncbi:penicillin-binding protein, beta-lactamase class C [Caulobacter sp. AP07]|uniref:serine hydrolase domain-containing protein n=1 Tax=Caulobacter sp. AP07 TaxID=1144304 RepID=UPI000272205E|nr:serine hydrolase domain-containing protein [Caulobacter sp. AP07]EJL31521.1 penicillin-binding protein, beta-lactamase class C [Caulobacter sp. AP07]